MEFFTMMKNGGMIMYPLLICSIIVWAVVFEKLWFLSVFNRESKLLHEKASQLLAEKKINEAKGLCHAANPLIASPYLALFETDKDNKAVWEQKIARRLSETRLGLRRFLWVLGTIGASAPFIGLFGTVVGIIKSFESIAATGKSGFNAVASGLSEALIATASGILVAVMAVVFYNYFQTRLMEVEVSFKNRIEDLLDLLA